MQKAPSFCGLGCSTAQAVQKVFQFREVAEPSNPLHSAADPNVYMAVRDLMLSGQVRRGWKGGKLYGHVEGSIGGFCFSTSISFGTRKS